MAPKVFVYPCDSYLGKALGQEFAVSACGHGRRPGAPPAWVHGLVYVGVVIRWECVWSVSTANWPVAPLHSRNGAVLCAQTAVGLFTCYVATGFITAWLDRLAGTWT